MRLAITICLCACLLAIGFAAIEIGLSIRSIGVGVNVAMQQTAGHINASLEQFDAAVADYRSSMADPRTKEGLALWIDSSREFQRLLLAAKFTIQDIRAAVKTTDQSINGDLLPDIKKVIAHTDETLNGQLLSAGSRLLDEAGASIVDLRAQLRPVLTGLEGLTTAGARMTRDLDTLILDPQIRATLENISRGTLAGAKSLENTEKITARWAKPPKLIWELLQGVGGGIYRIFVKP